MAKLQCAKEIIDSAADVQGLIACVSPSVAMYAAADEKNVPTDKEVFEINKRASAYSQSMRDLLMRLEADA